MPTPDDYRSLSGAQKAAILMLALGEEQCGRLFALMHEDEIKEVSAAMAQLGSVRADMAERLSWMLGQARRGSETSAFTAAPELAAQIGCPIADFPDVLRALGLKPAERHPETNAVTRWRFASQKTAQRRNDRKRETATATGPFAALAALTTPTPAAPRRRRRRAKSSQPKSAAT